MIFDTLKRWFMPGRQVVLLPSDREQVDYSAGIDPEELAAIMQLADSGDVERLYSLAGRMLDKDWDIAQAIQTRQLAVAGVPWVIKPGGDGPADVRAARQLEQELRDCGADDDLDGFDGLIKHCAYAFYTGITVAEIVWAPGGRLAGFAPVPGQLLSFSDNFYRPRLRTVGGNAELDPCKFIIGRSGGISGDPVRAGMLRTLAWLHCFSKCNYQQLLRFIERYGMPFLLVRVDPGTFDSELGKLQALVRDFGPDGGGVFTKSVESELLQASAAGGDLFFQLLRYNADAVTKVILGQLSTSGESGGLSGGDAQSRVRQDLLEADCRMVETIINTRLAPVWTRLNFGSAAAPPRIALECRPEEDRIALGTLVKTLYDAGLECDPEEVGKRLNLRLTRRTVPDDGIPVTTPNQSPEISQAPNSDTLNLKQKYDAIGVAIRAGILTATSEIEEVVRQELGLPGISDAVSRAWEATGGIRQPITLKNAEAAAVNEALDVSDSVAASASPLPLADAAALAAVRSGALAQWFGPLADELAALANQEDEAAFWARLNALAAGAEAMDSEAFERLLFRTIASAEKAGEGKK